MWALHPFSANFQSVSSLRVALAFLAAGWWFQPRSAICAQSPLDYWTWLNPSCNGNNLFSITWGEDKYLAAGEWGTLLTSSDGVRWQDHSLPVSASLGPVAFGNGVFVIYGLDFLDCSNSISFILTSSDAEDWNLSYSRIVPMVYGRTEIIRSILFTNGLFIAVGGNSSFESPPSEFRTWIITSQDGRDWTTRVSSPGRSLWAVAYGGDRYVAVGGDGACMISTNGVDWPAPSTNYWVGAFDLFLGADVVYRGDKFYALVTTIFTHNFSRLYSSANGEEWTFESEIDGWATLNGLAVQNEIFIAAGENGSTYTSPDAKSWTPLTLPRNTSSIFGVRTIGGATYLLGTRGTILRHDSTGHWNVHPSTAGELLPFAVAFGNGRFVALGPSATTNAWYTTNGFAWITTSLPTGSQIQSVAYGNEKFVAVGYDNTILSSADGISWQLVSSANGVQNILMDVTWDGRNFIVVGWKGNIFVSPNGTDWTANSIGSPVIASVAASGNLAVASRWGGTIVVSTNYTSWTTVLTNAVDMHDGVYANGLFVFVGDLGKACISSNGYEWLCVTVKEGWRLTEIVAADECFVAAGVGGAIFTSRDGLDWNEHLLPGPPQVFGLAYGLDTIVACAAYGSFFRSDILSKPTKTIRSFEVTDDGTVCLSLLAKPGTVFNIQESDDLLTWKPKATLDAPFGRRSFNQKTVGNSSFFRALPVGP